ncbi:SLX9 [Candida pseudojiufengensis]|uniref:SLX9 n=1 Tax=Candida pseudojiufengensis TaxID=497109 RepID=UPI0022242E9F|nr:SLX9 [Candida pseudojiufengensis]KAI5959633.1 SLX9 [Candida pseudojiufengensis]
MAGIKKKSSLRDKSQRKSQLSSKISEFKEAQLSHIPRSETKPNLNPLLKLAKTTKKQKQAEKSDKFIKTLVNKVTFNTSGNISKSSLRRQKKKEKEQLKPKMNELLNNLPINNDILNTDQNTKPKVTKIVNKSLTNDNKQFLDDRKSNLNKPNPIKATGHKQIMKEESKNFYDVLKNPQFRSSPFDALKSAIKQNMD